LEPRVRYHQYDSRGNPQEISQEDGTHIVYLWGYNSSLPVAKIENATWSDVLGVVNQNILDDLTKTDGEIRTELNKLRSDPGLSNALITTITYNLGIGMTSQTTPNGLTTTYHYDSFGRLSYVKDSNGNILKKNEYVYQSTAGATNN
jgi:YD repeat-containing protein